MPSKTPKQAKFMRAIAHGWTPDRMDSPPSRAVAREVVEADRKYSGGFAENRYWRGGLASMDAPNAGYKGRLDWQEGGDVDPQLQRRIENTLGSVRGGHVNYYQEGGDVRPGHPEGPNPFESRKKSMPNAYARWERENHGEAPPPPPEVEPEELSLWDTLMLYAKGPGQRGGEDLAELEAETGEAHGGRVRYQAGGLAMAAPAGGVPPWIEPTGGLDSEYMDPQGYQFGGAARQYRGVPPQRGGIQRGGGRGRFPSRFQRRSPQRGSVQPQGGGLAAMMRQMQEQRGGPPPIQSPWQTGGPGPDPHQGRIGPGGVQGLARPWEGSPETNPMRPRGPLAPGGGPIQIPGGGGFGNYDPRIRTGPNPNIGRPGYDPIGDMGPIYNRPGPIPTRMGGAGKPRPGPGMMPPGDEGGGGVPGGPRVPPNMRGYLQRQRMMNRPPANVGGGANRVGMQDQQGGLARALQRGTGRPPMSRRMAFGRGAPQ